ncbi:hypothetical protein BDV98DRAFT_569990 [Pterulicium gracile]|uniref:Uncharacterized protein n=1 Tax=Pterulicium gracile TaxID=1884261 RepID=A0A5C3QG33_9AGAR|nr:hypothetical protein BDV98DRAFT_569990 [Pterula gracilis]
MQFTSTLVTLASLATVAVAGAINLEARQAPTFYVVVCTEPNLGSGSCQPLGSTPLNRCIDFAAVGLNQFDGTISSFAGTTTSATCTLYLNHDCTGTSIVAPVGSTVNLPIDAPALDNALRAYRCV